jgi:hypothetical protein
MSDIVLRLVTAFQYIRCVDSKVSKDSILHGAPRSQIKARTGTLKSAVQFKQFPIYCG